MKAETGDQSPQNTQAHLNIRCRVIHTRRWMIRVSSLIPYRPRVAYVLPLCGVHGDGWHVIYHAIYQASCVCEGVTYALMLIYRRDIWGVITVYMSTLTLPVCFTTWATREMRFLGKHPQALL